MFDKEVYTGRRARLRELVGDGLILLPGNSESPANYRANEYHFRQDSTFLYFFGISHADYVGVLDADSGEDAVYGDDYSIDDIIWMGAQPTVAEQAARVGVRKTCPLADVHSQVAAALKAGRKVHFLPPYRAETRLLLSEILGIAPDRLGDYVSPVLCRAVVSLRESKDEGEIAEIEKACEIGYRMHTAVMRMCRPGIVEREIAGAIEGIAHQWGWGVSFHSIVSQSGETLHNHYHGNTLEEGRLVLTDAGAETTMNYCSDFTRTIPVSGRFTQRQKDVYNIVLAANARGFELSAPGMFYRDVHLACCEVIVEGLKSLGLVRGDVKEAVAAGVQGLFMPHGIGHQMGLDVHDMENIGEQYVGYDDETVRSTPPGLASLRMARRLKPGFVMTVEPGIYFIPDLIRKWRREGTCRDFIDYGKVEEYIGFGGIRIEDDILITPTGNRMLGERRVPVTVEEIEEYMREHRQA